MSNEDGFGFDFGFDFWEGFGNSSGTSSTSNTPATLEQFIDGGDLSGTDLDDDGMATYNPPDPWGIVDRY